VVFFVHQEPTPNTNKIKIIKLSAYSALPIKPSKISVSTSDRHKKDKQVLCTNNNNDNNKNKTSKQVDKYIQQEDNNEITSKQKIQDIITNNNLFPPEIPVKTAIGKYGLMWPRGIALLHDAAPLLMSYSETGCPTDCGRNWTKEHIITALKRGAHPTAKKPEARRYLINQTMSKVQENFAKIVKWRDIKHNIPPKLKISPIAMIPHKSRDYRSILDLSFQLRINGKKQESVNTATNKLAPQKAMAGLGNALQRLIQTMAQNHDKSVPFKFAKCDIKDGFWRMVVSKNDSWNFCYTIPPPSKQTHLDDIEIVVPSSLQMGWCESPPFFCAATETGRDIIQELFQVLDQIPPHPMEHWMMKTNLNNSITKEPHNPTQVIEVYVDDFISGTNKIDTPHLLKLSRAILHGIHSIFPPPDISNHCGGDPISEKKMANGDGTWAFQKEILGWILDGQAFTVYLPPNKSKKIQVLLKQTAKKPQCTLHELQQVAGKLNHACIGIPSGRGLLSPINNAMQGGQESITITPQLKQTLQDWIFLLQRISSRPTSVLELTAGLPWFIAYVDASKFGVGGVWVNGTKQIQPTVWRMEWPQEIKDSLTTYENKKGTISISDLEMSGIVLSWLVLECISPIHLKHAHIGMFCDNTPAVAWSTKLASSKSVIGGHLCRALAVRQHVHQASPLLTVSIAGIKNDMADIASRAAKTTSLALHNTNFLSHFNTTFPLPQETCWHRFHLPAKLSSRVTSCLRGKPLTMASWTRLPNQDKNIGLTGLTMQQHTTKAPSSKTSATCTNLLSSQHTLRGSGQVTSVEAVKSEFRQSLRRYRRSQRPSNWLASKAQSTKQMGYTKSQWHGSWKATAAKTPPPCHSLQFPSAFRQKCKQQDMQQNLPRSKP
jgi:hypothetical protein